MLTLWFKPPHLIRDHFSIGSYAGVTVNLLDFFKLYLKCLPPAPEASNPLGAEVPACSGPLVELATFSRILDSGADVLRSDSEKRWWRRSPMSMGFDPSRLRCVGEDGCDCKGKAEVLSDSGCQDELGGLLEDGITSSVIDVYLGGDHGLVRM